MRLGEDFARAFEREPLALYACLHRRATEAARRRERTFLFPELAPTVERLERELRRLRSNFPEVQPEETEHLLSLEARARELRERGTPYHGLLRLTVDWLEIVERRVRAGHSGLAHVFAPRCREELEYLLHLWPDVLAFPTFSELTVRYFRRTRPVPLHALGLIAAPRYADGQWCSPADFFFHDVDHVRFLVREDLLALGVDTPDPYRSSDAYAPAPTFDPWRGRHRTVLDRAVGRVDCISEPARVEARWTLARRVDARLEHLRAADPLLGEAAGMLLFELVHEKGFPLEARVLREQLALSSHASKLAAKLGADFYGPGAVAEGVPARLEQAREWLSRRAFA